MTAKKITGKQVNLLLAVGHGRGIHDTKALLEWLEYAPGIEMEFAALEDIPEPLLNMILERLRRA